MDFALSEEQERLRDGAREVLARECPMERVRKIAAHTPHSAYWCCGSVNVSRNSHSALASRNRTLNAEWSFCAF